jgi:hypothetical protein
MLLNATLRVVVVWAAVSVISAGSGESVASANVSCQGSSCDAPDLSPSDPLLDRAARLERTVLLGLDTEARASGLTIQEYGSYGGIGAIVCTLNGVRRVATAFLVGGFDIAVTVADVFAFDGHWAEAHDCLFANAGPAGQVRERIPLVSRQAQWQIEPETFGQPRSDLAVARLGSPAKGTRRTMSLTRFAHTHAPVILVGFSSSGAADPLKRKVTGHVYPWSSRNCVRFTHDIDSRNLAPGAPLIDARDGVVIGLHTRLPGRRTDSGCTTRGNAMIPMNQWLESAIRAEIARKPAE